MVHNQYDQYNQHPNYYQNQGYGDNYHQQGYTQQNYYNQQQNVTEQPKESESDPWNWGWEDNNSNQPSAKTSNKNLTESANDESWNWSVDEASTNQNTDLLKSQENHVENTQETVPTELQHSSITRLKNENLTPQWSIESQVSQDSSDDILLTSESDNKSNILSRSSTISQSPSRPASTHDNIPEYTHAYRCDDNEQINKSTFEQSNTELYQRVDNQVGVENLDKEMRHLSINNSQFENKEIITPETTQTQETNKEITTTPRPHFNNQIPPPIEDLPPRTITSAYREEITNKNTPSAHSSLEELLPPRSINNPQTPPVRDDKKYPKEITPPPRSISNPLNPPLEESRIRKEPSRPLPNTISPKERSPIESTSRLSLQPSQIEEKRPKEPTPPPPRGNNPLLLPPTSSESSNRNPYKRTTVLSHNAANTLRPKDIDPNNLQNIYLPNQNLGVNLETLPDNSERPDPIDNVPKTVRKTSVQQQWAENCEIAPINDRNQYLETGQLSDADVYNQSEVENTQNTIVDNSDSLPPPGLRRLVLGQLEQSETNQLQDNVDEPPPGLSRMVLGRTETANTQPGDFSSSNVEEPPVGLHRMVPGESSSPESSSYPRYQNEPVYQQSHFDDDDPSEMDLNIPGIQSQRSATIGADTPPTQATTAGYSSSSSGDPIISRVGAVGIDSERRETDLDGANTLDESLPSVSSLPLESNRRNNIDGGPQEVRNQTVGQNPTDLPMTSGSQDKSRKSNRSYTNDSDHEQKDRLRGSSPGRYRDRRYYDDRRHKDRESPDKYRDRKYDRRQDKRYEDDTDYYSDKERNERRHREERDEYDRRYNSLRRDKDRDRRRRDYERDDRRNDYYYRYDYEDYRDINRLELYDIKLLINITYLSFPFVVCHLSNIFSQL